MDRKRILLVDDDPRSVTLLAHVLSAEYEIQTATTAREALAALERFEADVVLLDMRLPDMHGLALARVLKDGSRTGHLRIVAVTAAAMKGDAELGLAHGLDGYITKPIDKALLRALLKNLMHPSDATRDVESLGSRAAAAEAVEITTRPVAGK